MQELTVIGGGPAGVAAGVYAARKRLKTTFITKEFGGQSIVSDDIQNWIGTVSISGSKLASDLEKHLSAYAEDVLDIKKGICVDSIEKKDGGFLIRFGDEEVETKGILLATGSDRRKLDVEGANDYEHKGLTYCASCDGPLFTGKNVAVIGGGNAGFETAAQLLAYTKSVTLLNRSNVFKADQITIDSVSKDPKFRIIKNAGIKKVYGDNFIKGLIYKDTSSGEEHELPVEGIFVEIGLIPNTKLAENIVDLDEYKRIKIDPMTQETSTPFVWAAGDCTNAKFHQNNIAAGDAVKAIESAYLKLKS